MMKLFATLVFLISTSFVYSNGEEGRMAPQVQVLSDEYDKEIPEGKCLITGDVNFKGEFAEGAEVCSHKGKECVLTNVKGEFKILVDTSEVYVYASLIGARISYLSNYEFKSQHHLSVKFFIEEKNTLVKKPVIYLYSEEEVSFNLQLNSEVDFSFTYPPYQDGWDVSISPEKEGVQVEGESYPYLFWEGKDYGNLEYATFRSKLIGQIVRTDTIVRYLESQLNGYGLSTTEATDFITFWGPILSQKEYAFVQFVIDDEYNKIASITCSQTISAERRVFLMYESFNELPAIEVTNVQPGADQLDRTGLVLIEWGGAEVSLPKL